MEEAQARRQKLKGIGQTFMTFAHPEDGAYMDRLREQCLISDEAHRIQGKVPTDWVHSKRLWLRANTKKLKDEWLEDQGS